MDPKRNNMELRVSDVVLRERRANWSVPESVKRRIFESPEDLFMYHKKTSSAALGATMLFSRD